LPETFIREFVDTAVDPPVRGFLHIPEAPNGRGLVLTHGAGGNAQAPLLRALAETFAAAGFTVLRCNLPYRQLRSFGPPAPADAARDRAGLKNALVCLHRILADQSQIDQPGAPFKPGFGLSGDFSQNPLAPPLSRALRQVGDSPDQIKLFLGGHSYGGRQSSMLCAELCKDRPEKNSALPAGLLLLSYPLHPPRRPEQQRTAHLPDLCTPTLFIHGTRDPFASIAELEQAIKMIPAKIRLLAVEGAGHDLGFKGKATQPELPRQILTEFSEFLGLSS
jgi:uncharacterized protein